MIGNSGLNPPQLSTRGIPETTMKNTFDITPYIDIRYVDNSPFPSIQRKSKSGLPEILTTFGLVLSIGLISACSNKSTAEKLSQAQLQAIEHACAETMQLSPATSTHDVCVLSLRQTLEANIAFKPELVDRRDCSSDKSPSLETCAPAAAPEIRQ
jgi:hypothetical protein